MSSSTHGGKGDRQRPKDTERFNTNWDLIFKGEKKDDKEVGYTARREAPVLDTTRDNNPKE